MINREGEDGIKPVEYLQSTNPFVIIDEPQNMETELRRTAPIALRAFFIRKAESFYTLSMKKELVKTIFISATN